MVRKSLVLSSQFYCDSKTALCCCSVAQSCPALWSHGLQCSRLPCPSLSLSLLKLMSIESVMPFNHLILCSPLPLLPSIFPSIRVISNESTLKKAQFLKNIKRRIEFCDVRITVILNVSNHNKVLLEHTYTFKETKVAPLQGLKVSSYQSPWLVGTKNFQ